MKAGAVPPMTTAAPASLVEEILELKKERNAVILAHHYQETEIQEIADSIGDSLELARKAKELDCEVIAFCGVWFMAETAKILNPARTVVVPDQDAGCSLVDSCPVEMVRAFKRKYPDHAVVSYINTSADVKAESDIICTSRNAVAVVNSIPAGQPILFLPDINLGNYVKKMSGRQNMRIWQGACIVHATFAARKLTEARNAHPGAFVVAHPECPAEVLQQAGYIGSTSALIDYCVKSEHKQFIVMTESGVQHSLRKLAPEKEFWFVSNENCNCSECPYMKRNSLEKLRDCLDTLRPRVEMDAAMMDRARLPIERMLAVK
ncbi:MAG: quinolinate synthase NadA [Acidobacteria bacterium]|nr:quinolinate synthase NadA [Acidobacteriota bacterium]